jgi:hypothetical protein
MDFYGDLITNTDFIVDLADFSVNDKENIDIRISL